VFLPPTSADSFEMPPRPEPSNHFRFEEADHRFRERVVVGIAPAADGCAMPASARRSVLRAP